MPKKEKTLRDIFGTAEVIRDTELATRIANIYPAGSQKQIPDAIYKIPLVFFASLIDELRREPKAQNTSGAATDRTDTYTVPTGKRWRLTGWYCNRAQAEAIKVYCEIGGQTFYLSNDDTAVNANQGQPTQEVVLDVGDTINVAFTTGVSGNLISRVFYTEEDAY